MPRGLLRHRSLAVGLVAVGLAIGAAGVVGLHDAASAPTKSSPHSSTAVGDNSRTAKGAPRSSAFAASRPAIELPVPETVAIPRLSVLAPVTKQVVVQTSGLEKGLLSAPNDFHDLGWYRHGTVGVLVIDGHVGFAAGAGPLAYIGSLSAGNSVVVTFPRHKVTYRVTTVNHVLKGDLPPRYFGPSYSGQLMLITCDYQSAFHNGHFADNVYAIAAPVTAGASR
ncbi:MAG: class F sortase [Acidimicrobiales bacterium]